MVIHKTNLHEVNFPSSYWARGGLHPLSEFKIQRQQDCIISSGFILMIFFSRKVYILLF